MLCFLNPVYVIQWMHSLVFLLNIYLASLHILTFLFIISLFLIIYCFSCHSPHLVGVAMHAI